MAGSPKWRLLKLIAESGQFDVFVTVDKNLPHQQNLAALPLAIVILRVRSTRVADVLAQAPALLSVLREAKPGQAIIVALPT